METPDLAAADLRDACPVCPPGLPDAAYPIGPVTETGGDRIADYQCPCGTAWTARFNRWGFLVDQLTATIETERAAA